MRQFDGAVLDYSSTPCWVVAAKDCTHKSGWVVLFMTEKPNDPPHVRLISPTDSLVVDMTPGKVKVSKLLIKFRNLL